MTTPISVIIPSYNGLDLLREYLPEVKAALAKYRDGGEIIIVEDGGNDGSAAWLGENHRDIRSVRLDENLGFAEAANRGVKEAKNEVIVLLNNDLKPEGDFFEPLIARLLSAKDIFTVSAKSIIPDGGNESISRAEMDDGLILFRQPGLDPKNVFDEPVTLFNASAGFSAYRRDLFLELGGFDSIYHPFYWEDVALCFRAWRRGWRCVYEPRSLVRHRSHGTIGNLHKREQYDLIQHAHQHLFHLLNLEGSDIERYLRRVNRLMTEINLYDRGVLRRGFFMALGRLDRVMERRKKMERGAPLADIIEASANKPLDKA